MFIVMKNKQLHIQVTLSRHKCRESVSFRIMAGHPLHSREQFTLSRRTDAVLKTKPVNKAAPVVDPKKIQTSFPDTH